MSPENARVLIIEDDMLYALKLSELMTAYGHSVFPLLPSLEAVRNYCDRGILRAQLPHVIVVDQNLPDGLGTQAVELLQESAAGERIPVPYLIGNSAECELNNVNINSSRRGSLALIELIRTSPDVYSY